MSSKKWQLKLACLLNPLVMCILCCSKCHNYWNDMEMSKMGIWNWENFLKTHKMCLKRTKMWKNSKIRFSSNLKIEDNLVFSTEIKAKHCQRVRCPTSSKNKQSWPASRQYWARLTLLENLVQKRISKIHNEQQKVATEACMPTESSSHVHIMLFKMP